MEIIILLNFFSMTVWPESNIRNGNVSTVCSDTSSAPSLVFSPWPAMENGVISRAIRTVPLLLISKLTTHCASCENMYHTIINYVRKFFWLYCFR